MVKKLIPERKDIPEEHRWILTPLFETDDQWEELFNQVEKDLDRYKSYKRRLKESVTVFKEALDFHLGFLRRIERLYTYAHLKSDEDKSDQFYLGLHQRAVNLLTRGSESASYMTPEIQAIPDEIIKKYCKLHATFLSGNILTIRPDVTGKIVTELRKLGAVVRKDNDLIGAATGGNMCD